MTDLKPHQELHGDETPQGSAANALREFRLSDDLLLSSAHMGQYSDNFVAAYKGQVVGVSPSLTSLIDQLNREAIPLRTVAIRFIEKGGMASA
jgi:hypothetical protein